MSSTRKPDSRTITEIKGDINILLTEIYKKGVADGIKKAQAESRKAIAEAKKTVKKETSEKIKQAALSKKKPSKKKTTTNKK